MISLPIFIGLATATQHINENPTTKHKSNPYNRNIFADAFSKADGRQLCFKTLQDIINEESFKRSATQKDADETYSFFISTLINHREVISAVFLKKPIYMHVEKLKELSDNIRIKKNSSKCKDYLLQTFAVLSSLRTRTLKEMILFYRGNEYSVEEVLNILIELRLSNLDSSYSWRIKTQREYDLYQDICETGVDLSFTPEIIVFNSNITENLWKLTDLLEENYKGEMKPDAYFKNSMVILNRAMILTYSMIKEVYDI